MAASEQQRPAEVQAYLDKHKINSLFEDLLSKIVKEQPLDPVDFLIAKLQLLQRQRKKVASPSQPPPSRSKLQVTGTGVSSKPTTTTSPSTSRLAKSSGNVRPSASSGLKPKSTLTSASTPAISKTARPTTTTTPSRLKLPGTPTRPKSSGTTTETKRPTTAPSGIKAAGSTPSGIKAAGSSPSGIKTTGSIPSGIKAAGSSPSGIKTAGSTPSGIKAAGTTPSGIKAAGSIPRRPQTESRTKVTTAAARKPPQETAKGKDKVTKKTDTQKKPAEKPTAKSTVKSLPQVEEEIDDFFGEAKKSSTRHFQSVSDDEDEELFAPGRGGESAGVLSDDDDEGGVDVGRGVAGTRRNEIDLEEFFKKRLSSKQAKNAHQQKLQSLLTSPEVTPPSSGYISDEDDSEESEVVMMEDYAALEEEGVTGLDKGKYAYREAQPLEDGATVDLKVLICARCAKVITQGEPVTESSEVSQSVRVSDFESASQVGIHASFPQWDAGSVQDSDRTMPDDAASDVTLKSHDTWGGLGPQTRPPVAPSETESEVQLPPPPPLEGKPWIQEPPPQHDPYGWGQEGTEDEPGTMRSEDLADGALT